MLNDISVSWAIGKHSTHWAKALVGIMVRVFANSPGDRGSIPGQVIPKNQNIQHYKIHIKGKMEQSRERSSTLPYILV